MTFKVWADSNGEVNTNRQWPKTEVAAIKASVAKWEAIAEHLKENPDEEVYNFEGGTCSLCTLFYKVPDDPDEIDEVPCLKCPVYKKTGKHECHDTPFWDFFDNQSIDSANAEVKFLKSLLPKGKV